MIFLRILGIDPGLATVGYGCIDAVQQQRQLIDYGTIQTEAGLPFQMRLEEIAQDLSSLLTRFQPDIVAVEELFFSKNVKTAIDVAQVRGMILYVVQKEAITLESINPIHVKECLTGDGRADKKQVQKMVQLELKLSDWPKQDDAADALAIALSCAARSALKAL